MSRTRAAIGLAVALAIAGCSPQTTVRNPGGKDPRQLAELHVQMAVEYLKQDNDEVALKRLQKALDYDSSYAPAHGTLGLLYARLGEDADAERHFQRALQLAPQDSATLNNFGQFLCARGRAEQAIELFDRALENPLYRTPAVAHTNAGLCALASDERERAETRFRAALQADPRFAPALLRMSQISLDKGEHLSARGYLQRYAEVATHTPASLWLGVRIERALEDRDAAASYALALRSRFPDSEETRRLLQSERE